MEKLICKECGKIFEYPKMSSCKAQLKNHLKRIHNMELVDYVVKYEHNGIHPTCACGCGNKVSLGNGCDSWAFRKYYSDVCYGKLLKEGNEEIRKQYEEAHKNDFDIVKYYEKHYDRKTYEEAFNLFKQKEMSLSDVSQIYKIDKRTLKKIWLVLKITDGQELKELLDFTKYKLSTNHNENTSITHCENILAWMYQMIKTFPGKYTIHGLIKEYNKSNPDNPCVYYGNVMLKNMYKTYGDEIDFLLASGYHSKEEYKFYEVLSFYFDSKNVKMGKKFVLKNSYIYFDFLVGKKILIEYDSDGYYHGPNNIEHDLEKEDFAKKNGYVFMRLTKNDVKNIETLNKIKTILENEIS